MKRFALLVALALLFFTDPGLAQLQKASRRQRRLRHRHQRHSAGCLSR